MPLSKSVSNETQTISSLTDSHTVHSVKGRERKTCKKEWDETIRAGGGVT